MPIPQSNVIFFYLFAAFFIFITLRGELRKYMGFLLSTPTSGSQVTRGPDLPDLSKGFVPTRSEIESNNSISKDVADIGNIAKFAAMFA